MDAPWCLLFGFLFVNADGVVVLMNVVHVNVRGKKCNKQCGIAVAKYGSSEDSVQVVGVRIFARVLVFTFPGIEGRHDVSRQTHFAGSFTIRRVRMDDSMAQAQIIIVRSMLLHLPQPFLQSSLRGT